MDDTRWTDLKDDLARLLDLDAADRAAALDALSPDARREIERWLRISDEAAGFLGTPAAAPGDFGAVAEAVADAEGDDFGEARVGPYRIVDRIGRGGMGDVFLAERADGLFEQRVALKRIRRGGDSAAVLARFADERRILARLRHPGIARLLDAGVDDDGRPWIAMDYVRGVTLTEATAGQPVVERVRLIAEVAATVHAAHQALVVHRDLKPSNVLVAPGDDGRLHPTLLDFGIAKVLDPDDDHVDTESGVRPMTRAYAAPEQVRGEPTTTATDVHALGVLLYEVLTGQRPYRGASATAVESAIVGADPTLPSRAVTDAAPADTFGSTTSSFGAASGTTSGARPRELRGDLDTICLKALRKSPAERYASAEAFEADLRRFLDGLPIAARPPSAAYRARKFVGRHPLGVGAAVGVLVAVVAGSLLYTSRVTRERDRAEAARVEAVAARDEAEAAAGFLEALLVTADPFDTARRDTLRLGDLFAVAVDSSAALADRPLLHARVALALARVALGLGRVEAADSLVRLALARLEAGPADLRLAAMSTLGGVLLETASGDAIAEAVPMLERAYRLHVSSRQPFSDRLAAREQLGEARYYAGDLAGAHADLRAVVAARRRDPSASLGLASSLHMLARTLKDTDPDEAGRLLREHVDILRRRLGPEHPGYAHALYRLAQHYSDTHDLDAAEAAARESLRLTEAALGREHPDVLSRVLTLATIRRRQGATDEAVAMFAGVVAVERGRRTSIPRDLRISLTQYADALLDAGRFADADAVLAEALGILRDEGGDPYAVAVVTGRRARVALQRGRPDAALVLSRRAMAGFRTHYGTDENAFSAPTQLGVARALARLGRRDEAAAALAEGVRLFDAVYGPDAERSRQAHETTYASLLTD